MLLKRISNLIYIILCYVLGTSGRRRVFYPLGGDDDDLQDTPVEGIAGKKDDILTNSKGRPELKRSEEKQALLYSSDETNSDLEPKNVSNGGNRLVQTSDDANTWSVNAYEFISKRARKGSNLAKVIPLDITPKVYKIRLICTPSEQRFKGETVMTMLVNKSVDVIELNAGNLSITEITLLTYNGRVLKCDNFELDRDSGYLRVHFERKLRRKYTYDLTIRYYGYNESCLTVTNNDIDVYKENQEYLYMALSEDAFISNFFPCYLHPHIRSLLQLSLEIPLEFTAVSNTELSYDELLPNEKTKLVHYHETPHMSAHLLSFSVGRYKYLEKYTTSRVLDTNITTKSVKCGVYFSESEREYAVFAVECACNVLQFLEEYTLSVYPLSKIDQVFMPIPSHPYTSGWGIIIHSFPSLLKDSTEAFEDIKYVIAKRIARTFTHQWFGNLIVMKYWPDLWFSEAVSSFIGQLVLYNIYPQYDTELSFISDELEKALEQDSLESNECITLPHMTQITTREIFDEIRCSKCACLLRMAYLYVGEQVFKNTIRSYIEKYKNDSVFTRDLWFDLKCESATDMDLFINDWLITSGYPLVKIVDENYDHEKQQMTLTLQQRRYYSVGISNEKNIDDGFVKWIPLALTVYNGQNISSFNYVFSQKESNFTFPYVQGDNCFWKFNSGFSGFYRVCTSEEYINKACRFVENNSNLLSPADKIQLLSDVFSLVRSGEIQFSSLLKLIITLKYEDDFYVLKKIGKIVLHLSRVFGGDESIVNNIDRVAVIVFEDKIKDTSGHELHSSDQFYNLKNEMAVSILTNFYNKRALALLKEWSMKLSNNHKELLSPYACRLVLMYSIKCFSNSVKDFDNVISLLKHSQSDATRNDLLFALGAVNTSHLLKDIIDNIILDPRIIRRNEVLLVLKSIIANNIRCEAISPLLQQFLMNNWDLLVNFYRFSSTSLAELFYLCFCINKTYENIRTITTWIKGDDLKGYSDFTRLYNIRLEGLSIIGSRVVVALESIVVEANWVKRCAREVSECIDRLVPYI